MMLRKDKNSPRKLRSRDDKQLEDKNLFNFDNINHYLYREKEIRIDNNPEIDKLPLYTYYKEENNEEIKPKLIDHGDIIKIKRKKIIIDPNIEDPLPDSTYQIFHRKMRKEEAQMLNEEKIKNLMELDNFQNYLKLLNQYDWIRHLPSITKINDLKNLEEMEIKKNLTIDEIEKMLYKQSIWKKKKDEFANNVRLYNNQGIQFEIIDEEYDLSQVPDDEEDEEDEELMNEVAENNNGAEKSITKKVVKRVRKPKAKIEPKVEEVKEKLEDIDGTINIDIYGSSDDLFGSDFFDVKVSEKGFQLPISWRRQYNTFGTI
ncbi:hypothetical protein KGF54_001458 [Candida jiufengensis]|uniref:uncharacterized protein n=1 Tax=Candida jiufengensis TaxID=497108 RepID=UPI00222448BC|nr:uncharacterized protein KGF54_001458 [Candida jiufengensis]KAI5954897.1 hypothetical protein KGF54_001458 [Candida jiufengensis]